MTARSPSAFFLSAALHAFVVGVVVLFSYLVQTSVKEAPKVFELVAGAGDDYAATAAPALGVPGGIKVAIPEPPAPKPVAAPPAPVPAPVVPPAPVEKAVKPAPTKTEPTIPDMAKNVKRIEKKRQAKIEAKDRAERERLTKAEFDRQQKAAKAAAAAGNPKVKHIDTEGVTGGVIGGSTASKAGAGGKALTREEGDLLDAYFSMVKQRLRDGLDKPPGLSDSLTAEAEFMLNADGSITRARIARSSGSNEFDQAVLDAIRHFEKVRPPSIWGGETVKLTFRMKDEDEN